MLKAECWSVLFPARISPEYMNILDWLAILFLTDGTKDLTTFDVS